MKILDWFRKRYYTRIIRVLPGDVILVNVDEHLSSERKDLISLQIAKYFDRNSVLVLDNRYHIDVLRNYEEEVKISEE